MSDAYKMYEFDKAYFITLTVVDWVDVFTKKNHKLKIIGALKFCQKDKDLEIFGWCLMSNHLHIIARAGGKFSLSEIIRDFKKFTAKEIIRQIIEQNESRQKWMLNRFVYNGRYLKRIEQYKFWQDGNHTEIIYTPTFFMRSWSIFIIIQSRK